MTNNTLKEPLRVMGIDIGTKYTAIFFNDYHTAPFKDGKYTQCLKSDNYKEHISFIMNWIRRLKPNLVIYERMLDGEEKIRDRVDGWNLWKVFKTVIMCCQESNIEGIPIAPNELKHYRSNKCVSYSDRQWTCEQDHQDEYGYKYINEFSWIQYKKLDCKIDQLPKTWKEQAKAEGFVWVGEEECNELDATLLWEYWHYYDWVGDTKWIEQRKELHRQELKKIVKPVIERSKVERRYQDNKYLNRDKIDKSGKIRIECNDCKKPFFREDKYISKTRPNCCYDCIQKRKIGSKK